METKNITAEVREIETQLKSAFPKLQITTDESKTNFGQSIFINKDSNEIAQINVSGDNDRNDVWFILNKKVVLYNQTDTDIIIKMLSIIKPYQKNEDKEFAFEISRL